jgi:hypothetical protein
MFAFVAKVVFLWDIREFKKKKKLFTFRFSENISISFVNSHGQN